MAQGRELRGGEIVAADDAGPLCVLFGEMAPDRGVTPATERMVLVAVQVKGVPDVSVEEALWTVTEILSGRRDPVVRSPSGRRMALQPLAEPRPFVAAPARVDERAARRSLLDQIARLESDLAALFCTAYPRTGFEWSVPLARRPAAAVAGRARAGARRAG